MEADRWVAGAARLIGRPTGLRALTVIGGHRITTTADVANTTTTAAPEYQETIPTGSQTGCRTRAADPANSTAALEGRRRPISI
jgi:hypothetical protein